MEEYPWKDLAERYWTNRNKSRHAIEHWPDEELKNDAKSTVIYVQTDRHISINTFASWDMQILIRMALCNAWPSGGWWLSLGAP